MNTLRKIPCTRIIKMQECMCHKNIQRKYSYSSSKVDYNFCVTVGFFFCRYKLGSWCQSKTKANCSVGLLDDSKNTTPSNTQGNMCPYETPKG